MELIHSAQIDSEITKDLLVQPFENKIKIYKRLKELSVMEPFLSENEAKDEFLSALTAAEKQQERKRTSKDISSARTNAEEKKIMDDIRRRKTTDV
jgi:DNA primase